MAGKKRRGGAKGAGEDLFSGRDDILAVTLGVIEQLKKIVDCGIDNSGMKLRDVTGAIKDIGDVLDRSGAGDGGVVIRIDMTGEDEEYAE